MPLSTATLEDHDQVPDASRRLPDIPLDRFRTASLTTCDTVLRRALPPGERWMVAAYGE